MDTTYNSNGKSYNWNWLLLLSPPLLAWVFWKHPILSPVDSSHRYILHFSWITQIKFWFWFAWLYLLPGLFIFYRAGRRLEYNPFFSWGRFLLSLGFGMSAHVLAIFLQKYLQLSYHLLVVVVCLIVSYGILTFFCLPLRPLLKETKPTGRRFDLLALGVLLLALIIGLEFIFRARTSSVNLMGDAMVHFLLMLGTLQGGPLPDGAPLYSTFILNLHPLAFHALLANLKTLMPGLEYIDLLRYYSSTFYPVVLLVFFAFFSYLAKNQRLGAIFTLVLIFVSGGGLTTRVPVIVYPYYWTLAWCFTAILFYFILKMKSGSWKVYLGLGILLGVASLFHAYFPLRVGTILIFFFIFELIRRTILREDKSSFLKCGGAFFLGSAIPIVFWLGPLLLKYSWEPTYSYEFIITHFQELAPQGVAYIQKLKNQSFDWMDLVKWTWENVGIFPWILLPFGIWGWVRRRREPAAMLVAAWVIGMAMAVLGGYLPNPYRYFEYFFLGLLALICFGLGGLYQGLRKQWRPLMILLLLTLAFLSLYQDFYPKYRLALRWYGRTQWSEKTLETSRKRAKWFLRAKSQGTLDSGMGWFKGYLWGRQKKAWDLYLSAQEKPKKVK